MASIRDMEDQKSENWERVQEARQLFRRGYAWIDALGNVGLKVEDFPFDVWLTPADHRYHDAVWAW